MIACEPESATTAPLFAQLARPLMLVATLVILAHGCHGPDEDHEPTVVPPMEQSK